MKHDNYSWKLGRNAMIATLAAGFAWGSLLILAVFIGREANVIGDMFAGIAAMIVTTLAVLVGGKGWKEFSNMRFGGKVPENDKRVADSDMADPE